VSVPGKYRNHALPIAILACAALALIALYILPGAVKTKGPADPVTAPLAHQTEARTREVDRRFNEAVVMLHAKQFDHAMTALHRVLELAPKMPEAHVNMGYAMLGLERFAAARDFFTGAIELRPAQANAYYGLALALDALNERSGALGAMRTYVHLAKSDDAHVRKARAALWEWQSVAKQDKPGAPSSTPPVGNVAQAKRAEGK
jgi:Flp pilus assembly protein TadD